MLLPCREIELEMLVPREAFHGVHHTAVDVRVLFEPVADERIDRTRIADRGQGRGQRLFQVAFAAYASMDHGAIGCRRAEEFLAKSLSVDAEVLFDGRVP